MEEKRVSSRKTRVGKVVSDKMDKTVVVAIADRVAHPLYKKIVGRTYKLKAHDEENTCRVGDTVAVIDSEQTKTLMTAAVTKQELLSRERFPPVQERLCLPSC